MQRYLNFLDIPVPETHVWETLQSEHKIRALEVLARLIAQAALTHQNQEQNHD